MSKTILAEVDGFTPVIDTMISEVGLMTATVFGKVWRYCQMSDGVCTAAQDRLADELGVSRATINQHIERLVSSEYLQDLTPALLGKPHTYRDTGKAGLSISFTAQPVKNLDTPVKNLYTEPVKKLDTKIVVKKELREKEPVLTFENLQKANRTVDALLEQERVAQEKQTSGASWSGRERIPEPIRELLDVYVQITGQKPGKGKLMDWLSTGQEWLDQGATGDDVQSAYKIATPSNPNKGGFLVTRPGSLTSTIGMLVGKRHTYSSPMIDPMATLNQYLEQQHAN